MGNTATSKIRFDRLEELAEHLEKGVLSHERFDISTFRDECGTAGCALGECPTLWPEDWKWIKLNNTYFPVLQRYSSSPFVGTAYSAYEWFGIDAFMFSHLFYRVSQITELFGGEYLYEDVTRYQVASNIRAFIEKMKSK